MPSAARAYSAQPQRMQPQRTPSTRRRNANVRVVPGRASQPLSPSIKSAARVIMVLVAMFAILACLRIGLTAATVNTAVATEKVSAQIDDMRSYAASLEVQESTLANPAYVRSVASGRLGMVVPSRSDRIDLGMDAVRYNEEGALSLSSSLAAVAVG